VYTYIPLESTNVFKWVDYVWYTKSVDYLSRATIYSRKNAHAFASFV